MLVGPRQGLLQVAGHALGIPLRLARAERHHGRIPIRRGPLLVGGAGGRVRLVHVHAVQQMGIFQRPRPVRQRVGRGIPARVQHQGHVGIDLAHRRDQAGVEARQITRPVLHRGIPRAHRGRVGMLAQRGAVLRGGLVDQVVGHQRRVPVQCARQVAPERLRQPVVVERLPEPLVDHPAVLLLPAQQRQRQGHQHHLDAGGIGIVEHPAQGGDVGRHQALVAIGIAHQEIAAAGRTPLVRCQPYPGGAGGTQRIEIGAVRWLFVEAVAAPLRLAPESVDGGLRAESEQAQQHAAKANRQRAHGRTSLSEAAA